MPSSDQPEQATAAPANTRDPASPGPRVISGLGPPPPGPADQPVGQAKAHLPVLELDPRTYDRALDCVHCGLCLPACPTYTENGLEADSPRGRITLMKGLADGRIEPTDNVRAHLDLCLDCRACETACPSGVVYHELIEETRHKLAPAKRKTLTDRLLDVMFFHVFPHPTRLKLALLPARIMQRLGLWAVLTESRLARMLPDSLQKMQQMLPASGPLWESALARQYPSRRPAEAASDVEPTPTATRVGFFAGCVGSVLFQHVNRQSIDLLTRAGAEVLVPTGQQCCGAIHHHGGAVGPALRMAKANIDAMLPVDGEGVDLIVTNVAGCGAMLKDYDHLLRDDPDYADRAKLFVQRLRDISEALVELNSPPPPQDQNLNLTATYHDACHLLHAQRVQSEPESLLAQVPGLELIPLAERDMCCGAAGTYNLAQPQMARQLAERKLRKIQETGARLCITANAGCAMQIQSEARRLAIPLDVKHPVSVLHDACFGQGTPTAANPSEPAAAETPATPSHR